MEKMEIAALDEAAGRGPGLSGLSHCFCGDCLDRQRGGLENRAPFGMLRKFIAGLGERSGI
jgi:hypothetical protein